MNFIKLIIVVSSLIFCSLKAEKKVIWQIGDNNNSGIEFALSPNDYTRFIEKDFGWEDKYFLIGTSDVKTAGHILFLEPAILGAEPGEHQDGALVH